MQTELEQHEAKMKKYGLVRVPSLPPDPERERTRLRKVAILGMNTYRKRLPKESPDEYKPVVDWEAEIAKAMHEKMTAPLGIGEWFHDEPCGVPDGGKAGLTQAFEFLGVEARYNTRSSRAEIRHESFADGWRTMHDRLAAEIREVLSKRFEYEKREGVKTPLKFGRDAWADTFNAYLFGREVDPFAEWLDALPRWDRVDRLGGWLEQVFTIDDPNGLVAWTSRFILLGAVTRAYKPGAKLDEMPVLIGRGGIGKSTALRYILPPEMPRLFSDGLHLAGTPQERAEALQGRVIVEASELAGVSRADLASLKAFLSRTDDGAVRLAFRRDPELMLRRAIIVGTSDVESPLPNDRNLRRWAPIYLQGGNPAKLREYLDANRVQLWAQAVHVYKDGAEARLPDALVKEQFTATSRARSRDVVIEDAVDLWTANQTQGFTMAECAEGIGLTDVSKGSRLHMRDQHRLGAALDGLGYTRKRETVDGVRKWLWNK